MLYLKIHESYRKVVALCDADLVGRKFEEGRRQLDVSEHFFKGEKISFDEAIIQLKNLRVDDATFNIVGKNAIKVALDSGVLSEESVAEIDNVKFGLVLV